MVTFLCLYARDLLTILLSDVSSTHRCRRPRDRSFPAAFPVPIGLLQTITVVAIPLSSE